MASSYFREPVLEPVTVNVNVTVTVTVTVTVISSGTSYCYCSETKVNFEGNYMIFTPNLT